jgi:poly-gamma-glutamate system protein
VLIIFALIALVLITFTLTSRHRSHAPNYRPKIAAVGSVRRMMELTKDKRTADGYLIDPINDPNQTGLIGLQHSLITTEYGDLTAKLTTLNPNFAALIVQLLADTGAKPGDPVAVSLSGSFPALNLEALAAIEALELEPVIITSAGASMWGANDPNFTYLDLEKYLYDCGLISHRTRYASIGGVEDIGRGLSPEGRTLLAKAIERSGVTEIKARDLDESVRLRMQFYRESAPNDKYRVFINIGGGAAALGGVDLPSGIVEPNQQILNRGVAGEFLRLGVPVVNLSDISRLARLNNLPIAPIPLPPAGRGKLFYEIRYSVPLAGCFTAGLLIIIFIILRLDVDYYLKKAVKKGA